MDPVDTYNEFETELPIPSQRRMLKKVVIWLCIIVSAALLVLALGISGYLYRTNLPVYSLPETTVTITSGESAWQIAQKLADAGIVRSEVTLFLTLRYLEDPTQIKASTYRFDSPQSTRHVANTLIKGQFVNELRRITFVEGMSVADFAQTAATLPNITNEEFLKVANGLEGSLFPETYFVQPDISADELVELLYATHIDRIAQYQTQITTRDLSMEEALVLASIIEREANTLESMRTVAGIFFNRLNIGMPLQADASIEYVIDTPLNELPPGQLASELRELDSPYNTYLYAGLPPTPIGNPGGNAILAIANPIESEYLYYITGKDGEFYYAKTYDEHLANIARHLR